MEQNRYNELNRRQRHGIDTLVNSVASDATRANSLRSVHEVVNAIAEQATRLKEIADSNSHAFWLHIDSDNLHAMLILLNNEVEMIEFEEENPQ